MTPPATNEPDSTEKEASAVPVESDATTEEVTDATDATDVPEATELTDSETTELSADEATADETATTATAKPGTNWARVLAYGILPALALILALAAGYLKWQDSSVRDEQAASTEAMAVAKASTIKLLSYKPDTVEQDLTSARNLLTGDFQDSYTQLTNDVVIPGSKQKQISAVATVPAIASVSADPNRAVMLVFVNQTVVVGSDAPTATASSVQVTLEHVGDHWLISKFDPI